MVCVPEAEPAKAADKASLKENGPKGKASIAAQTASLTVFFAMGYALLVKTVSSVFALSSKV